MKCYCCEDQDLIWNSDENSEEGDDFDIITSLSCPKCEAFVVVYWGREKKE